MKPLRKGVVCLIDSLENNEICAELEAVCQGLFG